MAPITKNYLFIFLEVSNQVRLLFTFSLEHEKHKQGEDMHAYVCHANTAANSLELSGKISPSQNLSIATWEVFSLLRQDNTSQQGLSFLQCKTIV